MRVSKNLVWSLFFCCLLLTSVSIMLQAQALVEKKTLNPTADSYVESEFPSTNLGRRGDLLVRELAAVNGWESLGFLMFDLSSIPSDASIQWAKLRLLTYAVDIRALVGVYLCSDNGWTEDGITFNNMPSFSQTTLDTANVSATSTRYEWNITETVKSTLQSGDKRLSLVLRADTLGSVLFYSRQNPFSPNYYPELVVQYDAPPQTGIYIPKELIIVAVIGAAAIVLTLAYMLRKGRKKPTPLPSERSRME